MTKQKAKRGAKTGRLLLKHFILMGVSFVLAGIVFLVVMDSIILPIYQRSGSALDAPDLRGMPLEHARAFADSIHLELLVMEQEFDNSYPAGTIARQTPVPGTSIKPGRRIRVMESLGSRPLTVPDVVGKTPRDARLIIQAAGLHVEDEGEVWVPSNDHVIGIITRQDPPANAEVPENTGMMIYISNGKPATDILMPDLRQLSLSAARDTLASHNFNLHQLKIQYEENSLLLPDTVIEQYPDPGQPANTNAEVNLDVSTRRKEQE